MNGTQKEYDERAELTAYVWRGYRHLMTADENLADHAFSVESKMRGLTPLPGDLLSQRERYENNQYVQEAFRRGYKGFQEMVQDRISEEMPDSFFISRCPACQRVVATPKAKQCLWCGKDWHG